MIDQRIIFMSVAHLKLLALTLRSHYLHSRLLIFSTGKTSQPLFPIWDDEKAHARVTCFLKPCVRWATKSRSLFMLARTHRNISARLLNVVGKELRIILKNSFKW